MSDNLNILHLLYSGSACEPCEPGAKLINWIALFCTRDIFCAWTQMWEPYDITEEKIPN